MNQLYTKAWDRHLAQRYLSNHQLTLTHGDAYPANFLAPHRGEDGPIYMMDWQSPYTDFGARDLASLLVPFWTPAQRQQDQREARMLHHYLATFHTQGVTTYAWDQLFDDYRWVLIEIVQQTIWDHANGSSRDYWWPKVQTLISSIREHDCLSILR